RHRPLLQRALHAGPELALIEGLADAVVLDHPRQPQLGSLERRKALPARRALAAAAHHVAVAGEPGIEHPGVVGLADRAAHRRAISPAGIPGSAGTTPAPDP